MEPTGVYMFIKWVLHLITQSVNQEHTEHILCKRHADSPALDRCGWGYMLRSASTSHINYGSTDMQAKGVQKSLVVP
jgi:hypothetical protein